MIETSVAEVLRAMRERGEPFELVIAENGSTDGTKRLAAALAATEPEVRLISLPEADYGHALRAGFLAAHGEVVVNFDADYFDVPFVDRALAAMAAAPEPVIVVGSKRGEGSDDTRAWSRRLVTFSFSTLLRVVFGLRVSDTHGIKALCREPLVDVAERCRSGRDLFDTELVLRAERAGLHTTEIPVQVRELRPSRTSIVSRIPRSLVGLARLRVTLWRGR